MISTRLLPWISVTLLVICLLLPASIPHAVRASLTVAAAAWVVGLICWRLALARAERKLQAFIQDLIDAIPEPIYIKDAQARFLWVNDAFAKERRRPAAELVGLSSFDLSPNAQVSAHVREEDQLVLAGGQVTKEQHTTYPVTNEECFRLVSKRRSMSHTGQPLIIGAHFDITRIRQTEAELQATLAREIAQRQRVQTYMQRLIDVIPQPVYVKDAESRYLMVNDAFCKFRLLAPADLIGKTPLDLSGNPEHSARVVSEDQEVLAGRIINKEEYAKHPITGEDVFRVINKGSCLDADGRPVIVGANFDITAWRMAEIRWRQASAAKSRFLATMSHEIRTPLSGVIGMLQLVRKGPAVPAQSHGYLETALNSAEALLAIISDILDFSKIEAGQLKLEQLSLNLPTLAQDVIASFRERADQSGLALELEIAPEVPEYVEGDPVRVRQILVNLLGNALKFTERGHITLAIAVTRPLPEHSLLRFRVTDTGVGIAPEVIPELFQMFQQADTSTTRRFGGTGLGLAICRQLVTAMGGEIHVTSQMGKGSCFEFTLDLRTITPPATQESEDVALPRHSRSLSILCAEDVRVNQLIIGAQLNNMGHQVQMVSNGLEAIRALAEKDYDLVLMDGRMPEMDGTDATRTIRAGGLPDCRVRNPAIRIVALTANASTEDREQALAAGMNDYLTKPVREPQLHAMLSQTIQILEAP